MEIDCVPDVYTEMAAVIALINEPWFETEKKLAISHNGVMFAMSITKRSNKFNCLRNYVSKNTHYEAKFLINLQHKYPSYRVWNDWQFCLWVLLCINWSVNSIEYQRNVRDRGHSVWKI